MSYVQKTANFQLPQWELSEPPQMNDFNTAFSNIDQKAVPTTRTINGHSLSSNITLTPEDLKNEPWKSTKTITDNGWTIRYQKSGYRRALIQIYKTLQAADTPLSNQVVCYVPAALKPTSTQYLTVRAVGNTGTLHGMGTAELKTDKGLSVLLLKSPTIKPNTSHMAKFCLLKI